MKPEPGIVCESIFTYIDAYTSFHYVGFREYSTHNYIAPLIQPAPHQETLNETSPFNMRYASILLALASAVGLAQASPVLVERATSTFSGANNYYA